MTAIACRRAAERCGWGSLVRSTTSRARSAIWRSCRPAPDVGFAATAAAAAAAAAARGAIKDAVEFAGTRCA